MAFTSSLCRSRALRSAAGLLLGAWVGACGTETLTTYAPYEGEAFPPAAAPIPWPARPALVTDSLSDTVSVIDLGTGELVAQRPVGRNPVDVDGPHHVAFAGDSAFIGLSYPAVGTPGPHAGHGSSSSPGYVQRLRLSDLAVLGQVRVDPNPGDIVASRDGSRIVVSHFDLERALENPTDVEAARATIAVIDPATVAPQGSPSPRLVRTCVAPHGVALAGEAGDRAFVACYGEDRLAIVDLAADPAAVELVDVGPGVAGFGAPSYGPYALALSPDESTLYVSSTVSKDVRVFDVASGTFDAARTITTPGAPYFAALDAAGERLVIPTQQPDALVVVDVASGAVSETVLFEEGACPLPHQVLADGDGFFVVCEGDKLGPGRVARLDGAFAVLSSVEVGVFPDSILPVPGGAP